MEGEDKTGVVEKWQLLLAFYGDIVSVLKISYCRCSSYLDFLLKNVHHAQRLPEIAVY